MMNSDLIFISTGAQSALLQALIDSISGQSQGLSVHLIIVNQGKPFAFKSNDELLSLDCIDIGHQLSLSKARNIALQKLFESEHESHYLLFPDDDSTFKADFFKAIKGFLGSDQALLGKICNAEDGGDYRPYPVQSKRGRESLMPIVASVSLILPLPLVKKVGYFDEKLGVGAPWGSSEDLDYYLRCCKESVFCFEPNLKNYHPSRFGKYQEMSSQTIRKRFSSYTDGYLAVHYRYGLEAKLKLFAPKALAGALLCLFKFQFSLAGEYLWLFKYRLQRQTFFKKLKREHPEELAL